MVEGSPLRADAQRNRARILDAAEVVFAESGPRASTEEVARQAGVAIGTVFRHFPTKNDLLAAIMKRLLAQLVEEAAQRDLFGFFTHLVAQAAARKTVVDLLAGSGMDIRLSEALGHLEAAVGELLEQAQSTGAVTSSVRLPEVMALLASMCQGAVHGGWDEDLQARTLTVVFSGLRRDRQDLP
ncbi:TetR/AcrR family transcriptional regulator [Herbidospora sp. NBRC 101105]|uniref:TetR/AcrR family transcriptional regulator n=1 Tax=Herbidospora sp. NBRC 101105 TaxID=3032195 RepID=UPI00249FB886|nr:TetR/AcrR family transcriptional regulator [Herbidospora sp. NBRC 101105]GLX93907.1 TetR family transcriptional regulator [Herbidospora sp. NBRC 101105]